MAEASSTETVGGVPQRLISAATRLLAEQGPSAIKARAVASEAGLSTMVVYSHFGGVPELTRAVIVHGFQALDRAFAAVPVTDDPVADLAALALTCRRVARQSPHLYDLMFGLSTRATYRPLAAVNSGPQGTSPAFRGAYVHMVAACERLVGSGRVRREDPSAVAAQLWSLVHGFITLELADTFADNFDPVREVLMPMGVNLYVGLGDSRDLASQSHKVAAALYA
jgi:AcrR family transcriptional regulator